MDERKEERSITWGTKRFKDRKEENRETKEKKNERRERRKEMLKDERW